jgi:hypothetical protein
MRYLRDGRVMRVIRGKDEQASMEHYWLCGHCYQLYDFVFPPDGTVALGNKGRGSMRMNSTFAMYAWPSVEVRKGPPAMAGIPSQTQASFRISLPGLGRGSYQVPE